MHEQWVIGSSRDNPDFDTMIRIPIEKLVIYKNLKFRLMKIISRLTTNNQKKNKILVMSGEETCGHTSQVTVN